MVINWSMLVQMVDQLDYHMVGLGSTCLTILVKLGWAGKPPRTNNKQLLKTNVPKTTLCHYAFLFRMLNIWGTGKL